MLEQYFVKPATIDRLHGSWIAPQIEQYVTWLVERGYSDRVRPDQGPDRVRVR